MKVQNTEVSLKDWKFKYWKTSEKNLIQPSEAGNIGIRMQTCQMKYIEAESIEIKTKYLKEKLIS